MDTHTNPTPFIIPAEALAQLKALLGERLDQSAGVCENHGKDESWHPPLPPGAVAFAASTEEVSEIVKICAAHKVPMVPYGVGTSLEGHVGAVKGGISIDLGRMNQIVAVNAEDMDCTVQAGVTRIQLNQYLRDTGLFFPVDPGADATIGGMSATRASGTNAVRYGTMRENVLSLTVVLADGRIINTASRARKSAAGYDLTHLYVGSEGTLGVITEIRLRLYGVPETITAAVCAFPTVENAVSTVIEIIQSAIPIARAELLDDVSMAAINRYAKLDHKEVPTLFFEFHGTPTSVAEQVENVKAIAAEYGGHEFKWASRPEDRNKLWKARHDAYYATLQLNPGFSGLSTDVCVPISRLAEVIYQTRMECDASQLECAILGHVGDGNFHTLILFDPGSEDQIAEARRLHDNMVERALAADGTCTGEHGIGIGKIKFLEQEMGEGVSVMRALKTALDPDNLFNPGKIFRE